MIVLKSVSVEQGSPIASYDVIDSTSGRTGITVTEPMKLAIGPSNTKAEMTISTAGQDADDALEKMELHLELMLKAIKGRCKASLEIPVW